MTGGELGPESAGVASVVQRAMVARAEAAVLLGDVRAELVRWSTVLAEVELALQSDDHRPLDEHLRLEAARNRLFDVLAELSALADPFPVWATVTPDEANPA